MKKNKLTPEQIFRLRAINHYQAGHSMRETAREFGIHQTTVGEWVKLFAEGGEEALKAPLRPRPVHHLDAAKLRALAGSVSPKYERRIAALIDLAESCNLNETAATHGVTPQGLGKWRLDYLDGKWLSKKNKTEYE